MQFSPSPSLISLCNSCFPFNRVGTSYPSSFTTTTSTVEPHYSKSNSQRMTILKASIKDKTLRTLANQSSMQTMARYTFGSQSQITTIIVMVYIAISSLWFISTSECWFNARMPILNMVESKNHVEGMYCPSPGFPKCHITPISLKFMCQLTLIRTKILIT